MLCSREDYFKQVKECMLKRGESRGISERDFERLFDAAQGDVIYEDIDELVENIVDYLFWTSMAETPLVPWNFWQTPIGQAISSLKFKTERFYFIDEVAELYGCEESFIYGEKDRENLKVIERGRLGKKKNNLIVYEGEVERFLKEKGKPPLIELKKQRRSVK